MNPAAARKGNFFAGAVGYITHDPGKDTADRVAFTGVINMRTSDPEKAAKVMAWTALHAAELKEAAGLKATGRKTEGPVYHFTLNWEHGNAPDKAHMEETAHSALKALGFEEHEAVYAVHTDKQHQHLHIVVNRIHPVTGKAHNPSNDQRRLQGWAYEYEKRQGNVICLDRALKYEKDPELLAEYQRRLTQEVAAGILRESKPRPQWEAEKDAPFPKSKEYQELKAQFKERVREIAKNGRDTATRQAEQWEALKNRHVAERAALIARQREALDHRRSFDRGASIPAYPWKTYQADRAALKKQHTGQTAKLREELKAKDAPAIEAMKAGQKAAWREFFKLERALPDHIKFDKTLAIVARTPVGQQGAEYRDHLTRLFNGRVAAGVRQVEFGKVMAAARKAFYKDLAQQNAPAWDTLGAGQKAELVALRQRFDQAKTAGKARAQTIVGSRANTQQERRELYARQRTEAAALKAKHAEETQQQRQAWNQLNKDRSEAWGAYKARRAKQMEMRQLQKTRDDPSRGEPARDPGKTPERSTVDSYADTRAVQSRDTGRSRQTGRDAGQDNSPGRGITRKGPR